MPNIYKLRYENIEDALKDLIKKNVIGSEGDYINGTEAVVDCGIITLVYSTEAEPAIVADGYHYNIMTTDDIVFESEVFPKNAKYKFGGNE
jgi:hypothetical protein